MIRALLSMNETPEPSDAADALAVALCTCRQNSPAAVWIAGWEFNGEAAHPARRHKFHWLNERNSFGQHNACGLPRSIDALTASRSQRTMRTFLLRFFLLVGAACLVASAAFSVAAPSGAKLTFRRIFKGSSPEFIEITVREDSDTAAYEIRQLDEDPGSLPFQVSAAWRTKMFDLAAQLKHFQGQDLDVHRKIANLGRKPFAGIWRRSP